MHSQSSPAAPGGVNSILVAQQSAQDKINRELFIGNTPPGTSEMLLLQFFNSAMRRVKLCPPSASPIVQCRVNAKFAFVECASIQDANNCLNLSGIPFLGSSLKVSRPSKYTGPFVPAKTWQELTGQALPAGIVDPNEEKLNRELFIGNTTPEMTGDMLTDFLGKAMLQVGLAIMPGNPINACRVNGKFAFIELRTVKEAENALNLNNIPYMGAMLRVGRPSKYNGPVTNHGNWEDILAKYMSGELILPQGGAGMSAGAGAGMSVSAVTSTSPVTKVVELKNMLTSEDLQSDQSYEEILEDTKDECSQFGALKSTVIPRTGVGACKIFLEYLSTEDAAKAIQGLAGRTFDGRKVEADYFDEDKFANQNYA
jgi:RNA recognition motif-containing protein